MRPPFRFPLLFGVRPTDTPPDRTWLIPADNRIHGVGAETRVMTITATRTLLGVS